LRYFFGSFLLAILLPLFPVPKVDLQLKIPLFVVSGEFCSSVCSCGASLFPISSSSFGFSGVNKPDIDFAAFC